VPATSLSTWLAALGWAGQGVMRPPSLHNPVWLARPHTLTSQRPRPSPKLTSVFCTLQGIFTGLLDPPLTSQGEREAIAIGHFLKSKDLHFSIAFTSLLQRASRTLELILSVLFPDSSPPTRLSHVGDEPDRPDPAALPPPIVATAALNERDYGELNGRSKRETAEVYGEEQAQLWRRSYEAVPPGGESLKMTVVS